MGAHVDCQGDISTRPLQQKPGSARLTFSGSAGLLSGSSSNERCFSTGFGEPKRYSGLSGCKCCRLDLKASPPDCGTTSPTEWRLQYGKLTKVADQEHKLTVCATDVDIPAR